MYHVKYKCDVLNVDMNDEALHEVFTGIHSSCLLSFTTLMHEFVEICKIPLPFYLLVHVVCLPNFSEEL